MPDGGGFAIAAGLEQVIDYIQKLHFNEDDIDVSARPKASFARDFWTICATSGFTGDIWAVPEGTPVFPREPLHDCARAGHPGPVH